MSRSLRSVVLLAAVVLVLPVAAWAQDLDGARERVAELESRLSDATERYEQTWAEVERTTAELDELERRGAQLEAQALELESLLAERARAVFKRGSGASLELLLSSGGADVALERASLAQVLQERDSVSLEQALAARAALDQTVALAAQRREQLEVLKADLARSQAELEGELDTAQTQVRTLEQRAARQRVIDRGGQQGTYACPLDRGLTHFVDSWGFPRSGGRSHKGTDIMGPMGVPVYAFTSGVISRHSAGALSGRSLYLRGDDGNTYFYAHLQGYAPAGVVGSRVVAGDHIAYNGDTGNARGGAPHIHFEQHPGGGAAVNPYPYLAAACF
jgi:peptidoglycan LD-endopeptidase LytH